MKRRKKKLNVTQREADIINLLAETAVRLSLVSTSLSKVFAPVTVSMMEKSSDSDKEIMQSSIEVHTAMIDGINTKLIECVDTATKGNGISEIVIKAIKNASSKVLPTFLDELNKRTS